MPHKFGSASEAVPQAINISTRKLHGLLAAMHNPTAMVRAAIDADSCSFAPACVQHYKLRLHTICGVGLYWRISCICTWVVKSRGQLHSTKCSGFAALLLWQILADTACLVPCTRRGGKITGARNVGVIVTSMHDVVQHDGNVPLLQHGGSCGTMCAASGCRDAWHARCDQDTVAETFRMELLLLAAACGSIL